MEVSVRMRYSWAAAALVPCFPGLGLSTQRITKNPIMSMTRSAKVKIHSGHSSHSAALQRQTAFLAIWVKSQYSSQKLHRENPNVQIPNPNDQFHMMKVLRCERETSALDIGNWTL